ncbi:MAG: polysaccharide biosynthesis/export family protein [Gammaproteobacteria bacterium]|nr:polysaccharide biosynthesis/export family protein [Gammaproteobacteria bacterium]
MGDTDQSFSMTVSEYLIGVDDQLEVNVWRNPELSVAMPVRPDGKISVPLIGDIQAGGRTPVAVANEIQKELSIYVRNPNVTVILTELRNFEYISRIRVTGAVQTPTSFSYRQGMTVLDAVLEAGGVTEFAAPNRAKLYRQGKKETEVYDIQLGGILNQGELSTNFRLKPGDIITVPERFF